MNRKHGPILLIITVLCLAGLGFALWDMTKPPYQPPEITETAENEIAPAQITTIPDAPFLTIGGEQAALHDFKGKVLLLNFWATWCLPCVEEFPSMLRLAEMFPDELVFVAISVDQDKAKIGPFFARFPAEIQELKERQNVIIGHDPQKSIAQDLFQTVLYPESYLITPDLQVHQKIAGKTDWTAPEILRTIETLKK